ncbi:MAG TPA: MBL fold metallo-hydrolase [Vicinamibacteria bacterium]|nr:MBL fold metallo-hydrolase [Vicinamibacteria bacterium]
MAKRDIYEASRGIWCVGKRGRAAYIVKTSPGAVFVDPGLDPSGADMMMGLQRARVGLSSIRAILLTSGRVEARSAAIALQRRSRAKAFCSEQAARRLGSELDIQTVGDGDVVAKHFEVLSNPEESEGLCFYFRPGRALFVGDTSFAPTFEVEIVLPCSMPWRDP